jgi:hypothetical protein
MQQAAIVFGKEVLGQRDGTLENVEKAIPVDIRLMFGVAVVSLRIIPMVRHISRYCYVVYYR